MVMLLTVGLIFMDYEYGRQVKISRLGAILLLSFLAYNNFLILIFIDLIECLLNIGNSNLLASIYSFYRDII